MGDLGEMRRQLFLRRGLDGANHVELVRQIGVCARANCERLDGSKEEVGRIEVQRSVQSDRATSRTSLFIPPKLPIDLPFSPVLDDGDRKNEHGNPKNKGNYA